MPKTLLLADDSVTIQKVVGISFANEDIVLLTVDNGDDAITRAKEARPNVILADVVMPGKNGYEVCQAVKADPALAHIPVLLLTGTFEAFDEQRAARAGADGHITKPFEAQSLVDKVNALLARAEPPASAPVAPPRVEIGVLRPVRIEVPPAAPVSHTADTAYDFFDDEVTAPRGDTAAREDTTVLLGAEPAPAPVETGFGFDAGDIGDADPSPTPFGPAPAPETVLQAGSAPGLDELEDWNAPLAAAPSLEPAASLAGDELGFEAALVGPTESSDSLSLFDDGFPEAGAMGAEAEAPPADLRGETRLLADRDESPEEVFDPGTTRLASAYDTGDAPYGPGEAELAQAAASAPGPLDALYELELESGLDAGDPFGDAVVDPTGARDYDVSSSDLGAPLAAAPPPAAESVLEPAPAAWSSAWPEEPESSPAPEVAVASPAFGSPAPAALEAAASSTALGRDELRDMLEKMAWEAFGPLTERLVRDAVERIERVAWEVIPQLAETLIGEEIRKLKGE